MLQIFQLFIDIVLWRKGPQDVPASPTLLTIALTWNLGVSYVLARLFGYPVPTSMALTIIDIGISVGWLMLIVSIMGVRSRFQQSITALLGVGVLLSILNIVVITVAHLFGIPLAQLSGWLLLHLMVGLVSYGRVVALTIERSLLMGMSLIFAMVVLIEMLQLIAKPAAVVAASP
jgi:hypothetical protein